METKDIAIRVALAAKAKKALGVRILDMRKVSSFCDFFVIMSATSLRQVNALAQGIEDDLKPLGLNPGSRVSRNDESGWVVMDFGSVVAHVFYKPMREFYALERLWSDAKSVRILKSAVK